MSISNNHILSFFIHSIFIIFFWKIFLLGELIETRHILDEAEEEVDLEPNHYETDPDCKKAGKKLPDFDLYQTTVIPPTHRGINTKPYFTKCTECPECRSPDDRERFNAETARTLMSRVDT